MAEIQQVEGLAELGRALRQLPKEIASKNGGPLRKALFQAAKVIREEAKRRAPVHEGPPLKKGRQPSGTLKRNIIAKRDRRPDTVGATERYRVAVRTGKRQKTGDAFYWRFVEFGHRIVPRGGKRKGGISARRRAAQGAVPPKPFMRPAFESKKREAVQVFKRTLEKGMATAVKKAART